MGEEEKKPEEKKMEEKKPEEAKKPAEEKKEEKKEEKPAPAPAPAPAEEKKEEKKTEEAKDQAPAAPPPPQEIVLKVYMHCEGCARKVRRCLKGFEGVEDVTTDCKTHKVIVKGEKADPLKVLERVQRKSHRQVELLSPIPKPPSEEKKAEEKEKPKPEEKKEEVPIVTVVLKVYMHCEACAQEIKKRILRMKGVESAEPDLKSSQVTVKGALDPSKLVEYVHKRTGKHAVIVKQDPDKKESKEEKKAEEGGGDKDKKGGDEAAAPAPAEAGKEDKKEKKEGENEGGGGDKGAVVVEENSVVELKKNEFSYYYPQPRYGMEMYAYNTTVTANTYNPNAYNAYPPQIFSDENPNACSVM
ncbi:heavy metal-associated isoprenylated plant protein 7-like [Humulus lupulus]|uniref:heavy metal-associated isoprenylated plant protein 7-like n=1 Tax=Humulus lupulus TaxID=3486 RepID=UPI002B40C10E|nr:heavy metal-associated isoprenylated plant protein 7-like [Humulus lupulus]